MLCVLILYVTVGTYSLQLTSNDRFFEKLFMANLFTLTVFPRNLLKGNRRRNNFCISFWCLVWGSTSNKPTHYPLNYGDFGYRLSWFVISSTYSFLKNDDRAPNTAIWTSKLKMSFIRKNDFRLQQSTLSTSVCRSILFSGDYIINLMTEKNDISIVRFEIHNGAKVKPMDGLYIISCVRLWVTIVFLRKEISIASKFLFLIRFCTTLI